MTDQCQRRAGVNFADFADEIGKVVFELAEVANVSPCAGGAVAANIHGIAFHPARG